MLLIKLFVLIQLLQSNLIQSLPTTDLRLSIDGSVLYLYDDESRSWEESSGFCSSINGSMVHVSSEAEERIIAPMVKNMAWIGVREIGPMKKIYKYSDGSHIEYSNWQRGEPDHNGYNIASNNVGSCVMMLTDGSGQWLDDPCTNRRKVLCRIEVTVETGLNLEKVLKNGRTLEARMIFFWLERKSEMSIINRTLSEAVHEVRAMRNGPLMAASSMAILSPVNESLKQDKNQDWIESNEKSRREMVLTFALIVTIAAFMVTASMLVYRMRQVVGTKEETKGFYVPKVSFIPTQDSVVLQCPQE